jgi:hypothetical protein
MYSSLGQLEGISTPFYNNTSINNETIKTYGPLKGHATELVLR